MLTIRVVKVFIVFCLGMALSFSAFAESEVEEGSATAEGSAAVDESSTTTGNDTTAVGSATTGNSSIDDDVFQFVEVMPRFNGEGAKKSCILQLFF